MGLKSITSLDTDSAEQLAGVTGLGWTTSTLGFLGTVLGYGNSVVSRLVTDPQSLLYVGVVCFLATLGLDRVARRATDDAGEVETKNDGEREVGA
ncbi:hypothetical protein ACFQMA_13985 [Halosimplex aquaticum]|uniref:Uncharacterized protein n=1 Tax=Halosimplex aquaticum TaxID=3026162 RepID=A0ABD5Y5A5_9EURY|nr:hypothetical protein [Halosimplex aquaticum]